MICFWCDTRADVGLGHLVRCIAIAQWAVADGHDVRFVVSDRWAGLDQFLANSGFDAVTGALADIEVGGDDVVVVDGYDIDLDRLAGISARTVLIDDLGTRDAAVDLVVNPNIYATDLEYPSAARALLGSNYALLRTDFVGARDRRGPPSEHVERVFVMMGGTDPTGETPRVLDALSAAAFSGHVDVVTARDDLTTGDRGYTLTIHRAIGSPAVLMRDADLAFCAAGGSTWELACIGVPAVQVVVADNQALIGRWLRGHGLIALEGPTDTATLVTAFRALEPPEQRTAIAQLARELVDGRGAQRVADVLVRTGSR